MVNSKLFQVMSSIWEKNVQFFLCLSPNPAVLKNGFMTSCLYGGRVLIPKCHPQDPV